MPKILFTERNVTWTLKNSRNSIRFVSYIVTRRNPAKNVVMKSSTFNLEAFIVCMYLSFIGIRLCKIWTQKVAKLLTSRLIYINTGHNTQQQVNQDKKMRN